MPEVKYDYDHAPTIGRFSNSDAFIRGLQGPFGSGKSSGCVVEILYRSKQQAPSPRDGIRRSRWAVVRNTVKQLEDTTAKTLFQWLPPAYFGRYTSNDHRYIIKAFEKCEIEILFRALDRPDDVKDLLSLDLTGAWVNEAREIPWVIIEALMGRVGRFPGTIDGGCTWSGIWMDTNPPDVDSKWYRFFEEKEWAKDFEALRNANALPPGIVHPEDFAEIFHQPSGLSPNAENIPNLPVGYYPRLGIGKTEEWKKVYIHGQYGYVSDNKSVFSEFKDEWHIKAKDPVPGRPIEVNLDLDFPAITLSQVLPNGQWLIFDEMISTNMGIDRFSNQVLEYLAKSFRGKAEFDWIADPSGEARKDTDEKTCFGILRGKGIEVYGGEQNLQMRLESVRFALTNMVDDGPRLIVHPRCKNVRKAFLGAYYYRRLATGAERYSTEPEKNHPFSDLADGIEYRAVQHFGSLVMREPPQDDYPQSGRQRSNEGRSRITGY